MAQGSATQAPRTVGRYRLFAEIAAGGIATVHLGRLRGHAGFAKTVAIKKLHPTYARDPEFVAMLLDEARLTSRIQHTNVVSTLDVVACDGELCLVMEYVPGDSLAKLARREAVDPATAVGIMVGVLHGLHAAHEAKSEIGEALGLVHRDVSPQNILVGRDGVARIADFGIAKAVGRIHTTQEGQVKGKFAYMAPEQIRLRGVDRRTDVYAASVVLWEILTGRRLFVADEPGSLAVQVLRGARQPPSLHAPGLTAEVDAIVMRGLARKPGDRFENAREMAIALESALTPATPREVGEWVEARAASAIAHREKLVAQMEGERSELEDAIPVPPPSGSTPSPLSEAHLIVDTGQSSAMASDRSAARVRRAWSLGLFAVLALGAVVLWRSLRPTSLIAVPAAAPPAADSSPAAARAPAPVTGASQGAPPLIEPTTGTANAADASAALSHALPRPKRPARPASQTPASQAPPPAPPPSGLDFNSIRRN
jgi:eukaryotic-like serine/threonine-protein kinase